MEIYLSVVAYLSKLFGNEMKGKFVVLIEPLLKFLYERKNKVNVC